MEEVKSFLRSSAESEKRVISLKNRGIDDLNQLLDLFPANLASLDLSENKLRNFPSDLSELSAVHTLHIEKNPLDMTQIDDVVSSLETLPSLHHLYMDVSSEDEEETIVVGLPTLRSLNGVIIPPPEGLEEEEEELKEHEEVASEEDYDEGAIWSLETLRPLYEQVHEAAVPAKDEFEVVRSRVQHALEEHLRRWKDDMQSRRRHQRGGKDSSVADQQTERQLRLAARHAVLDVCLRSMAEYAKATNISFGAVFGRMHGEIERVFRELDVCMTKQASEYENEMADLRSEVSKAETETAELLEAAEMLEKETQSFSEEKEQMTSMFEKERAQLVEEIGWLRAENEKMLNRLRQYELRGSVGVAEVPSSMTISGVSSSAPGRETRAMLASQVQNAVPNKSLSLRQLKEVMEELYASKARYDKKCSENQLARETLDQNLYGFLNQKYGLRSLIVEWAAAIIQGVRKFSEKDNDVRVFGKILRNEVDEEFRLVQMQLKDTVRELVKVYLKGKYPMKRDDEIASLMKKKTGVSGVLVEEEWVDIVKYMYNHEDSVAIIVRLKEAIRASVTSAQNTPSPHGRRRRQRGQLSEEDEILLKNRVKYTDFVEVLLDFQLRGHERFLNKFTKIFRQCDSDRDGVVNEEQFRMIVRMMDESKVEEDVERLLGMVDPHNNQQITYSECVTFLSSELVKLSTSS